MIVATASTCKPSSFSLVQYFATPVHAPTHAVLMVPSADVKHAGFRSSMIDACGDSEHVSSILLIQ
jgi:hypothetical protein